MKCSQPRIQGFCYFCSSRSSFCFSLQHSGNEPLVDPAPGDWKKQMSGFFSLLFHYLLKWELKWPTRQKVQVSKQKPSVSTIRWHITLVIIRGATAFVWKFSIIFSAVTVWKSATTLIPALLIRQFKPSSCTSRSTSSTDFSILSWFTTSGRETRQHCESARTKKESKWKKIQAEHHHKEN